MFIKIDHSFKHKSSPHVTEIFPIHNPLEILIRMFIRAIVFRVSVYIEEYRQDDRSILIEKQLFSARLIPLFLDDIVNCTDYII